MQDFLIMDEDDHFMREHVLVITPSVELEDALVEFLHAHALAERRVVLLAGGGLLKAVTEVVMKGLARDIVAQTMRDLDAKEIIEGLRAARATLPRAERVRVDEHPPPSVEQWCRAMPGVRRAHAKGA
jgi:hypothetical protein